MMKETKRIYREIKINCLLESSNSCDLGILVKSINKKMLTKTGNILK